MVKVVKGSVMAQWAPAAAPTRSTSGRGSVTTPASAVAAAVSGEARNVRAPLPWRPSKLRLLVRDDVLARGALVAVHGDAHGAARLAPIGSGGPEDVGEALSLGLGLHLLRAGHDHDADALGDVAALEERGRLSAGR